MASVHRTGTNKKKPKKRPASRKRRSSRTRSSVIAVLGIVIAVLAAGVITLSVYTIRNGVFPGFGVVSSDDEEQAVRSASADAPAGEDEMENIDDGRPPLDVQLLTPNQNSRSQIPLREINGIVIHYTANPGASAQANRDYFENLAVSGETYASSHFIIGLEGEIIQCIPSTEISYASNGRNQDTLSIECCHPDETGRFNDATYEALVDLTAWCCRHFDISPDNVIRHYDVTGKNCPKYFVEHEDAWEAFLEDVRESV